MFDLKGQGHVIKLTAKDAHYRPRPSGFIEIIIPLEPLVLKCNNQQISVQLGDIIKVKPYDHFMLMIDTAHLPPSTTTAYILKFQPSFFEEEEWGDRFLTAEYGVLRTSVPTVMNFIGLTENTIHEIEHERAFYEELVYYHLKVICIHLYRTQTNYVNPHIKTNTTEDVILFETITNYISSHYPSSLTNKDLTKKFFVSEKKLISLFKVYGKTTPQKYVTARRLTAAKNLIFDGQSITQAATQVGYRNYSTFYRQFMSEYNVSPEEFFRELE